MQVLFEGLPEDAGKLGVHKDTLQTDVELRIRQNGIKVTDNLKDTQAIIYVNVSVVDNAAAIEVSIEQPARLLRNNSIFSLATTWNTGGLIVKVRGEKDVREYLLDLVDKFINAWLSVNPRSR